MDKSRNPTRISKFESLYDDTVEYFDDNESGDEEKEEDASDSDESTPRKTKKRPMKMNLHLR